MKTNKMRRFFFITSALVVFSVLMLSSCTPGSSSSDSDSDRSYTTISGVVSDPEISGAKIRLIKNGIPQPFFNAEGRNAHQVTSDEFGRFSLKVLSGKDLSNIIVEAEGGFDTGTGEELDDVELLSNMQLFNDKQALVISPLTSLVTMEMENGATENSALASVRTYLGLPSDSDPLQNPTHDSRMLKKSIMVTKLLKTLDENGDGDPVKSLATRLAANNLMDGEDLNDALLTSLVSNEQQRIKLKTSHEMIKAADANADSIGRQMYLRSLTEVVEDYYLKNNAGKTLAEVNNDNDLKAAFKLICEKTAAAVEDRIKRNLQKAAVEYVLGELSVSADADFRQSDLADQLDTLFTGDDAKNVLAYIRQLRNRVGTNTKYLAKVPLGDGQLLGNDVSRRLEYYYNSNVSNTYYAARTLENVFDDRVNDPIYGTIACTWAEAGDFERALKILDKNIYTNLEAIDARKCLAYAYGKHGKLQEASDQIYLAEQLLKKRINKIGLASVTHEESSLAQALAFAYFRADDTDRAKALLEYSINTLVQENMTSSTVGRIVIAYRQGVEELMNEKPTSDLLYLVQQGTSVARKVPVNKGKTYYKMRFMALTDMMVLYAKLNNQAGIEDILGSDSANTDLVTIYGLLNHPDTYSATGGKVYSYMPDVAKALAMVGLESTATEIAERINPGKDSHKNEAYAWIGIYKGFYGSINDGWALLENKITNKTDFIEYLTYNKSQRNNQRFAALLIDAGMTAKAETVLDNTLAFVDAYRDSTAEVKDLGDYRVMTMEGYRNAASLYLELGKSAKAVSALEKAESLLKDDTKMDASYSYRDSIQGLLLLSRIYRPFDVTKSEALVDDANAFFSKDFFTNAENKNAWVSLALSNEHSGKVRRFWGLSYRGQTPCNVFDSYLTYGLRDRALAVLNSAYVEAQNMTVADFDGKYGVEDEKEDKVKRLLDVNSAYARVKDGTASLEVLEKAAVVADTLLSVSKKTDKVEDIAAGYAIAFNYDKAVATAQSIVTTGDRNAAYEKIAEAYGDLDAFPRSYVARIDTDGDGKPDFFNAYASADDIAETALVLDDDIDGDGYLATEDATPYDPFSH